MYHHFWSKSTINIFAIILLTFSGWKGIGDDQDPFDPVAVDDGEQWQGQVGHKPD